MEIKVVVNLVYTRRSNVKFGMVKLWIFVEFLVKKKLDLDDVYFGLDPSTFVGNARETLFSKPQFVCQQILAQVFRVKIY